MQVSSHLDLKNTKDKEDVEQEREGYLSVGCKNKFRKGLNYR